MTKKKINKIDLTKQVLKKIEKDEVKMRPHLYFIIGSFLLGTGVAATTLFSTFLVNLISFRLKAQGHFEYLRFGRPGLMAFLRNFPWFLIILIVFGITGGIFLIRKLDISYRKNILGIIAAIIGFILIFGLAIDKIGFNEKMSEVKQLESLYRIRPLRDQVIQGKLLNKSSSTIELIRPNGETVVIQLPEKMIERKAMIPRGKDLKAFGSWQKERFLIKDYK
jgi:hypothetical protein